MKKDLKEAISWLEKILGNHSFQISPLRQEASERSYFRITLKNDSYVLMNNFGSKENAANFIKIQKLLKDEKVNVPDIFGFSDELERRWFNLLQSVQGIGAKASIAILSSMSNEDLSKAILSSDKAMISRAEGVGQKIAGRILNELKDKIPNISIDPLFSKENENIVNENIDIIEDAISALSNLGYNKSDCKKIVVNVYSNLSKGATLSELISICLKKLGNK